MENRTDHEPASAGSLLPAVMTGFWETDTTGQRAGTAAADNAEADSRPADAVNADESVEV